MCLSVFGHNYVVQIEHEKNCIVSYQVAATKVHEVILSSKVLCCTENADFLFYLILFSAWS